MYINGSFPYSPLFLGPTGCIVTGLGRVSILLFSCFNCPLEPPETGARSPREQFPSSTLKLLYPLIYYSLIHVVTLNPMKQLTEQNTPINNPSFYRCIFPKKTWSRRKDWLFLTNILDSTSNFKYVYTCVCICTYIYI